MLGKCVIFAFVGSGAGITQGIGEGCHVTVGIIVSGGGQPFPLGVIRATFIPPVAVTG